MALTIKTYTTIEIVDGDRRMTIQCDTPPIVDKEGIVYGEALIASANPNFHKDADLIGQHCTVRVTGGVYEFIEIGAVG